MERGEKSQRSAFGLAIHLLVLPEVIMVLPTVILADWQVNSNLSTYPQNWEITHDTVSTYWVTLRILTSYLGFSTYPYRKVARNLRLQGILRSRISWRVRKGNRKHTSKIPIGKPLQQGPNPWWEGLNSLSLETVLWASGG